MLLERVVSIQTRNITEFIEGSKCINLIIPKCYFYWKMQNIYYLPVFLTTFIQSLTNLTRTTNLLSTSSGIYFYYCYINKYIE